MPDNLPAVRLTHHAIQRGEERLRLKPESLRRMTRHAMTKGMPMAETHGHLLRWLQQHALKHGKGNQTCIRDGIVFVIENNSLITVLYLPPEHRMQVRKWTAKNRQSARSSGNLKEPRSGVMTPGKPRGGYKRVSNALKSAGTGGPQAGKWQDGEEGEP